MDLNLTVSMETNQVIHEYIPNIYLCRYYTVVAAAQANDLSGVIILSRLISTANIKKKTEPKR